MDVNGILNDLESVKYRIGSVLSLSNRVDANTESVRIIAANTLGWCIYDLLQIGIATKGELDYEEQSIRNLVQKVSDSSNLNFWIPNKIKDNANTYTLWMEAPKESNGIGAYTQRSVFYTVPSWSELNTAFNACDSLWNYLRVNIV